MTTAKIKDVATERRVLLPSGLALHAIEAGPKDGPPLLLVHGYADSHQSFHRVIPALSSHFRIHALDLRGHGDSDAPATGYGITDLTDDVIGFLDQLASGPLTLAGHSLGSIIGYRVALRRPDLVSKLILIGSALTSGGNATLTDFRGQLNGLNDPVPEAFATEFQRGTVTCPIPDEEFAVYVHASLKLKAHVWRAALDGLIDDPGPTGPIGNIPTLILWGTKDSIFGAADQEALRQAIPGAQFVVYPDVGHAPNWEIPDTVANDIQRFIAFRHS
jgi:pimeloyl-ACP methyl ester carboxylesterase